MTATSAVTAERYHAEMYAHCPMDALCDRCVEDMYRQLCGVAACRGEFWASEVAKKVPREMPWPDSDKMRAIARRKVGDMTRDTRLAERLAAELAAAAERRWAR